MISYLEQLRPGSIVRAISSSSPYGVGYMRNKLLGNVAVKQESVFLVLSDIYPVTELSTGAAPLVFKGFDVLYEDKVYTMQLHEALNFLSIIR